MDRLAKQQACQLFIEQEIEKGLAEGKSKHSIARELSALIKKFFQANVNEDTIRIRAIRTERGGTFVPPESTPENHGRKLDWPTEQENKNETIETKNESIPLFNLKRWWKKTSQRDRLTFLDWIKK